MTSRASEQPQGFADGYVAGRDDRPIRLGQHGIQERRCGVPGVCGADRERYEQPRERSGQNAWPIAK
jgi:hypothetical protein